MNKAQEYLIKNGYPNRVLICGSDPKKWIYVSNVMMEFIEHASQPAIQTNAEKCDNCGAELQAYCSNCFRSGTNNRTV